MYQKEMSLIEEQIKSLPKGSITIKRINGKERKESAIPHSWECS